MENLFCSPEYGRELENKQKLHQDKLIGTGFEQIADRPNVFVRDGVSVTLERVINAGVDHAILQHGFVVAQSELTESQKQNRTLQKMLGDALKESAVRETRLIGCLDHIVQSRFEMPVMPQPQEQVDNGTLFPVGALADVLSIDDDRSFLEKTDAA